MKYLGMLCLLLVLSGCGWMNNNKTPSTNSTGTNGNESMQNGAKMSQIKDLFDYFDEKEISYSDIKELKTMNINAHEGREFMYEDNPVYVYRMNMQDEQMNSWMNEIKNSGKVTINQNGKDESFDAMINGEYMMITKAGTDLNKLSETFNSYTIK